MRLKPDYSWLPWWRRLDETVWYWVAIVAVIAVTLLTIRALQARLQDDCPTGTVSRVDRFGRPMCIPNEWIPR